jgi:hypothetical protein
LLTPVRTYGDIRSEVQYWLDEVGETGVSYILVSQAANTAHERLLTNERWSFMLMPPQTFTTVIGQQTYQLDERFYYLMYAKNLTTGDFLTEFVDQNVLESGADWNTDTNPAQQFALWGHGEVANQPTTPSVITASSTNSGDDNNSAVVVSGDSDQGWTSEQIYSGNSGSVVFSYIQKVEKLGSWGGTMILTANSGTVDVLKLDYNSYGKSYQSLYLLAPPSQADIIEYRYYRQPTVLLRDGQVLDFPAPFGQLLVWETLMDMAAYNQYDKATVGYWGSRRDEMLNTMRQKYGQAHTINQQAVYTTYIER